MQTADLSGTPASATTPSIEEHFAKLAQRLYRQRRDRSCSFPEHEALFAEPAWDILLALYVERASRTTSTMTVVCAVAAVPVTTALRTVHRLASLDYVELRIDPADLRRTLVGLTGKGCAALESYFDSMG